MEFASLSAALAAERALAAEAGTELFEVAPFIHHVSPCPDIKAFISEGRR